MDVSELRTRVSTKADSTILATTCRGITGLWGNRAGSSKFNGVKRRGDSGHAAVDGLAGQPSLVLQLHEEKADLSIYQIEWKLDGLKKHL